MRGEEDGGRGTHGEKVRRRGRSSRPNLQLFAQSTHYLAM